jgi:hypothetical protein
MTALYAKKGERITCESGHPICTVAKDIPFGAMHDDGFFCDWLQPEPKHGMLASMLGCLICGAPWFASGLGPQLHFEDGWR